MTVNLSPEDAKLLNDNGATILILNVPELTEIGIDFYCWTVKNKFIGFKMIPPGIHILYSRVSNINSMDGIVNYTFLFAEMKEVLIYEWDKESETIIPSRLSLEDQNRYILSCKRYEFDSQLGPYPYQYYDKWLKLSKHINKENLSKIIQKNDSHKYFTVLPDYKPPSTLKPSEIINYMMDTSDTIINTINSCYNGNSENYLSEYEISFISLIIGEDYDGLEEWKRMSYLLCNADSIISSSSSEYNDFIINGLNIFFIQLNELPIDFLSNSISENNFVKKIVHNLVEIVSESENSSTEIYKITSKICVLMRERYKYDIENDLEAEFNESVIQ